MAEIRDPRTYAIIGAAIEVHRELGAGFLEPVYQDAMEIELRPRGIPFLREPLIPVNYKGVVLASCYKPDFICFDGVVVELKALSQLTGVESAQVLNYLKAMGLDLGLLLNFGATSLEWKRLIKSSGSGPSAEPDASK